ncbi:MAG: hypothetical protein IKF19_06665 [Bacilli bacterium]|nr:hypothetical protein [Bacilli bacterium]MBR3162394.1 hypothetical protein [Bacilli bacterium]
MKKLFIYYSLTGNGDEVARYLKDQGYDIRKIEVEKPLPNNFTLRILIGGFKALINSKEKLVNFDSNIDDYDYIIIGSPIWNDRLSSPITTALNELDLNNKELTFILYSGSGTSNKATKYIKKKYSNCKIINSKTPKKIKQELHKLDKI